MTIVAQGFGKGPGAGSGTNVTQVISSVDVELGPAELEITLEGQIVIELLTPQFVLCEEG